MRNLYQGEGAKNLTNNLNLCQGVSKGIFVLDTVAILDDISVKNALLFKLESQTICLIF